MRTKEEIQGEIELNERLISTAKIQLQYIRSRFEIEAIKDSIFWWNIQIEKLTKELKELNNHPKTL